MPKYQVALISKPAGWRPEVPDAVPSEPGEITEMLGSAGDLFHAVREAIAYNERSAADVAKRWAVVVEAGSRGRTWPAARLCTPLQYRVAVIWWPEGWGPNGPSDVPNCAWQARAWAEDAALPYPKAEALVRALNRQCIDSPGATWHVVAAVENEPVSHTASCDASGQETIVEVRRIHVIRPDSGSRGSCSHCPAHGFECATEQWQSLASTVRACSTRSLEA